MTKELKKFYQEQITWYEGQFNWYTEMSKISLTSDDKKYYRNGAKRMKRRLDHYKKELGGVE